jgi:sodium/proline symporter
VALVAIVLGTIWCAIKLRMEVVQDSLFAWSAMGAAFGPLLLVRLTGKRIRPGSMLGAMWSGFLLTGVFHVLPDAPGDILERAVPFLAALGVALTGGDWRHVADATPSPTVHDRLPI